MKYFTRTRVRRSYEWRGGPVGCNRKLKTQEYGRLEIKVEGLPRSTFITTGQHILIEGEDEDNPYVAKVVRLFGDESGQQKKAVVQWFFRVSEVPLSKMKLLGREPHPKEIFFYHGRSSEDDVDVESILRPVQVQHLEAAAPFPDSDDDTLYVKLSWDLKTFRVLDPALMASPRHANSSLPPSPPCSPPAATPVSRAPPTPDPAVMSRDTSRSVRSRRAPASTGGTAALEAEPLQLEAKLSASKCLSATRRTAAARTPGVRKRLQLLGPEKSTLVREDVLNPLLDEELELEGTPAKHLPSSPPLSLTSLRRNDRTVAPLDAIGLTPSSVPIIKMSLMNTRATAPSRRKESEPVTEPSLGVLAEEEDENAPKLQAGAAPRSSRRKSVVKVLSRIRKQLSFLNDQLDPNSDGDDEDEFVPSRKELQTTEEEEEEEEELDSDEEVVVKKSRGSAALTPRPKQKTNSTTRTPKKTPRKQAAPSTPRTPRTATPIIPSRSLPARRPANILEEARIRLHVSSVPESLPCREQEFQDIYSFVESKILDGTGGCMYISGVPGTGKTATVHEVMRCLQNAADMDAIPPFCFVEVNGMKMTDPHQAYVQVLQKLTGQRATANHAAALLEKRFSSAAPRKETTVLLVDELDLLWTRKQNVMYNLFDWPTRRHARLVVLTIANTMDLPERIMINRVASRLGLTRMSFQPYSFKQLQQIITSRLNKVKAFEEDALQLVSRKVAALSGDARRCLDICRRATEICEHSAADPSASGLVGMGHVMEALEEMFSSSYITAIRCASTQEQLFLRAVIAEFRRQGLEEATFQQVFVQHQALCRVEGLQPVSVSEGLGVCQRLGACRLLLLESSLLGVLQRVRLNVSQDDVLYALKAD
ncbi:origin recognition complex subunit 1 isoform X3 [Nothobranchius furzeri]|uniref:origin recognition complex subunit 1 isoform X3 n=1 Tax=Nothobranchius furzeri TaxID=105023 RepID=UPI002403A5BB|nr:origin recognition complex subunit 1 isoform X3 [Nothobranchius furzeri]